MKALLIDLDNTLVPEIANYETAFDSAARGAAEGAGVSVETLRSSVFEIATELWYASPVALYCLRLGLGCPTSLLSDFPGDATELAYLRKWVPDYRRESWRRGLSRVGMGADIGEQLDGAFRQALRDRCHAYADVLPTLERLTERYTMAVVTNGPIDVQQTKLVASGLANFFSVVVASSEVGSGKPEPEIFSAALGRLSIDAEDAIVVGDSPEKDIAGARAAGLRSIWLNRAGAAPSGDVIANAQISTLAELPKLLARDVLPSA
jgi:putative hydrolase of the HAD superfamily